MKKSAIRVIDGDTLYYGGILIRILGIDAPEIKNIEHGFYEDQPYGRKAQKRVEEFIKKAKTVEYLPFKEDRYGRLLAHVFVDGELLSVLLIRERLAYETVSYYGDNGFPKLAEKILKAAYETPLPPFEPPYIWKKKHKYNFRKSKN